MTPAEPDMRLVTQRHSSFLRRAEKPLHSAAPVRRLIGAGPAARAVQIKAAKQPRSTAPASGRPSLSLLHNQGLCRTFPRGSAPPLEPN